MSQLLELLADKKRVDKAEEFYNYFRRKAWEKGVPLIGHFELTPRCTLDCKMCYVHLDCCQMNHGELTTKQWLDLIDQSCDAGMLYATLTGGECLLHPGFRAIYEHLRSSGILVTILTNGTLLDEEIIGWLSERTPERIQVSVYGSSAEGYQKVAGCAEAFDKVDRGIHLLKKSGMPFNLAITLSRQMIDDFEAILEYCKSKGPSSCNVTAFQFEARQETGRDYAEYALSLEEQVEIAKIRLRTDGKNPLPYACEEELLGMSTFVDNAALQNNKGITCTAGRIKFSISWDGRMMPCNAFGFTETYPLADGFLPAWQEINRRACEYNMPAECADCVYRRVCIPCPAVHWMEVGEGRASPRVCAEGKRMALEDIRKL